MQLNPTQVARFWAKVEKTETCWLWQGSRTRGYGYYRTGRGAQWYRAHRLSYLLCVGDIPLGMKVLHRCDNPQCVNPSHLFVGTQLDNVQDMIAKGRNRHPRVTGTAHGAAKMTEQDVRTIRQRAAAGESCRRMATEFEVYPRTIMAIVHRVTWRGVE